ncbi:MAG: hypothetical protein K2X93_26955, partial [Candidatus Obscuribacterales bacterium]|nr:hypothetical protein [Candidatus Obscuribacterales bacterium]
MGDSANATGTPDDTRKSKDPLDAAPLNLLDQRFSTPDLSSEDEDDDADASLNLGSEADEEFDTRGQKTPAQAAVAEVRDLLGSDEIDCGPGEEQTGELDDPENRDSTVGEQPPKELVENPQPQDSPADRSGNAQKVADYDSKFEVAKKRLDATIQTALTDSKTGKDALISSQTQSITLMDSIGQQRAAVENGGDKDAAAAKEKDLELNYGAIELRSLQQLEKLPSRARDLQVLNGCFLISNGKDENVRAGEKALAELVRDNPALVKDEKFRDSVMRAYSEMAAMRDARGLPPWSTQLKVDDILPERKAGTTTGDLTLGQLMEKANEKFFNEGIENALPLFDQAFDTVETSRNKTDRERLTLFVQGISLDAQIAQRVFAKTDAADLAEQRAEVSGKEESSLKDSSQLLNQSIAAGVNKAFAKIASGDATQFSKAKKDLAQFLEEHPSIAFNDEFKESCRNAFKAHYQGRSGDAVAGTPPVKPQDAPAVKPQEGAPAAKPGEANPSKSTDSAPPAKAEESGPVQADVSEPKTGKPQYKVDWIADASKLNVDDDVEVKPYAVDTATTIGVTAFGIGMGVAGFLRARSIHRAARELKATVDKAHEVKPFEAKMPVHQQGDSTFKVQGEASDGRVVVKTSRAPVTDASTPFAEVKPDKFNPKKGEFGDYTPITVDGEKYYASKDGVVFKHEGKLLKETSATREIRLLKPEDYAKQRVTSAMNVTDSGDLARLVSERTFENGRGPRFERVNHTGIADSRRVDAGLRNADWKPYRSLGEHGQSLITPPLSLMRADIRGGRLDFTGLDSIPADATITLSNSKGGNWCLSVDKPGIKGDPVNYATMVLSPEIVGGMETGRERVLHVQPGEPFQSVDKISTFEMVSAIARLNNAGIGIAGADREALLRDTPQKYTVTSEQAKALGFKTVRVDNQLSQLSRSGKVESINAFADSLERAKDVEYGADTVKLLRDSARAIKDFNPATSDPQKLGWLMKSCASEGVTLFQLSRFDESVTFSEIHGQLEKMVRDVCAETLDSKPQEAFRRSLLAYARNSADYISRFAGADGASNEQVQEHKARQQAAQKVAELVETKTASGELKHSESTYADLATEIDRLAIVTDTTDPQLANAYREQSEKVRDFGKNGSTTVDGMRLSYTEGGKLHAIAYRDKIYQPGSLELNDGHLKGKGDVEGWLRRNPQRLFDLAQQLSSGNVTTFDPSLGPAVMAAADGLKEMTAQQIHDGLSQVLELEKAAVRDGKTPVGLRFLHATGVTSKPEGADRLNDRVHRGRDGYRPQYYSDVDPTAIDKRWTGLETGKDHAEVDRNWLADASGKFSDGVIVTKDGAVMAVGDAKSWLKENPLRVLDVVKMTGQNETIGLNLIQDLKEVAAELKTVGRGALFDKLAECVDPKAPGAAETLKFMEFLDLKNQTFPDADFSTPEKARSWLMAERIKQAVSATPDAYMHQLLSTRTPGNRMGSYWETVGDGKVATPESLARALQGLDLKPYNPVDANGQSIIKPPARAFQAEMPGGRMGLVELDSLPPDTKLSLVDPKGTGAWSLSVENGNVVGAKTNKVTFIVGPDTDAQGKPNGKECIWTIHPGDAVSPSPVNDAALVSANQALAQQGKELTGIATQGGIPTAEIGKPRTITGVTVEQAKALGFGLAKVATPHVAQVDRASQIALLQEQASRFPKTGGSTLDEGANRLLTDAATAVKQFQPNATQGERLRRLHTGMKAMATKLTESGRFGDAILFNEASSAIEPMAARAEANKVISDIKAKAVGMDYGHPVRDHYMKTAVYMEKVLNRGGFSDNHWGYDMMRQVMDARLQDARVMGQRTHAYEMASAGLRKICESMPEATTNVAEPGIAGDVAGSLKHADALTGFEGHTAAEIQGAHKGGNEAALRVVQRAEANPQFKRNASGYALISDLLYTDARTRTAQADLLADRGDVDYLKVQRAEGIAEVANVIAAEGHTRHSRDINAVDNIFQAARDAGSGAIDEARFKAVQRDAASLKEISPQALHTEITNLLLSDKPAEGLELMKKAGVLQKILPEVAGLDGVAQDVRTNPENNVWEHVKMSVETASRESHHLTEPQRKALVWAALLKETGTKSTQVVTPVEGQPPRVTNPNSEHVSAEHASRILDRFNVPIADQELIVHLVSEHKDLRGGASEDKVRELSSNHGADAVLFGELQRVDALSRGVHTKEQYDRLKLADSGLPSPVRPDGEPVSREQYWSKTSHQVDFLAQIVKIERGDNPVDAGSAPAELLHRMERTVSSEATAKGAVTPHNTGAHQPTSLLEQAKRFPAIQDGVKALVDQGRLDLASKILELSDQGPLQTRAEALLTDPRRLSDPSKVDLLGDLVGF